MTAIFLTSRGTSETDSLTTTIHTAKPVTPQRLELMAEVVQALSWLKLDEIKCILNHLDKTRSKSKYSQPRFVEEQISEDEQRELEASALKDFFEWRQELLSDSLTASEVAKLLNAKSRQTPHDRRKNNGLVAVEDNGVWKFPCWQFDPLGPDGVIAGLPDVLKALDIPDFSKISWLTQSNLALNGLTPVEALKRGCKDDVIAEARTVGVI